MLRGGPAVAVHGTLAAAPADCPKAGINDGVILYDSSAVFMPMYHKEGSLTNGATGCKVHALIGTGYTAMTAAMRAKKIDAGELGPLIYVLTEVVAGAFPIIPCILPASNNAPRVQRPRRKRVRPAVRPTC